MNELRTDDDAEDSISEDDEGGVGVAEGGSTDAPPEDDAQSPQDTDSTAEGVLRVEVVQQLLVPGEEELRLTHEHYS